MPPFIWFNICYRYMNLKFMADSYANPIQVFFILPEYDQEYYFSPMSIPIIHQYYQNFDKSLQFGKSQDDLDIISIQ